jgi:hypothetical protein
MTFDALNTVEGIQVFVKGDLEDRSRTLAADDDTVGKEEHPDPVPPLAISLDDRLLIANPVLVPPINSCRIVNTKDVNVLDFKTGALKLHNRLLIYQQWETGR